METNTYDTPGGHHPVIERWMAQQEANKTPDRVRERISKSNRYVWQAFEDIPHPQIVGGFIKRGRAWPILPWSLWERIMDVPLEMRLDVRSSPQDKEHQEARYEIAPGDVFDHIMEFSGHWGIVELRSLFDMPLRQFLELDIDRRFFPGEIPKPYTAIRARIHEVCAGLTDKTLLDVGADMLRSITISEAYDVRMIDELENQDKFKYGHPHYRALSRLERRPKTEILGDMAKMQQTVFERLPDLLSNQGGSDNSQLTEIILRQQQQIELLTAMAAGDKKTKGGKDA